MKFILTLLVTLSSFSAFADKDSFDIYEALTSVAAQNVTPAGAPTVLYKKAIGGLTCLRSVIAAEEAIEPDYEKTNCAINIGGRRDQAIFEALNVEAPMNGRNRVTKTVGVLSCDRIVSDTMPGPAPFYRCSVK